ncbi:hypothetical protein O181_015562 [Austropuccinia psidii MF-1]|uniref:Integrase catalytic domain-containing protein n=1 Tax=Austropuccinia psidii MF-1 TaxID=1389203 RepID=A0A9Q3C3X6_9BASI|nr:hypothetical protein [Austropuccinia psidii MF-1]
MQPLENIHLDICGTIQTASIGGAKYFMIIVDQCTGYINIKFLKLKNEAYMHSNNFKEQAENELQRRIQSITPDGGGEFVNSNFRKLTEEYGVNHIISPPYTPQNNGIAKRGNHLIIEKTRCLLLQSKLPPQFWAEMKLLQKFCATWCSSRRRLLTNCGMTKHLQSTSYNRLGVEHRCKYQRPTEKQNLTPCHGRRYF